MTRQHYCIFFISVSNPSLVFTMHPAYSHREGQFLWCCWRLSFEDNCGDGVSVLWIILMMVLAGLFWEQLWWWRFSSSDSCNDGVGRCLLKTDNQLKVRQTVKRATFCKGLLSYIAYMAKPKYVIKVSLFSHSKKWDCFSDGKLQNCFIYFIIAYMKLLQDFLQF